LKARHSGWEMFYVPIHMPNLPRTEMHCPKDRNGDWSQVTSIT